MRSSVAVRRNKPTSKFISLICAVTLCCGLVPSAAFAADDSSLSLIPEGEQGAAPIVSGAEGGSDDAVSHSASDDALSVDGGGAASASGDVSNNEVPDYAGVAEADTAEFNGEISGEGAAAIPAADLNIINQVEPLQVVAQAESTRSYFLAQTLESTHTVPVVSAKLPIDTGAVNEPAAPAEGDGRDSTEDDDGSAGPDPNSAIAVNSTVVGSFEYLGMTFAIEAGGESVALVAADYAKLPQEFVEKQVVVIPESATADGIDYFSVTRIAANAFASFKKDNAEPSYVSCEALLADEELLNEAAIDSTYVDTVSGLFEDCHGILILGIPASVTAIEDDAFRGFDTLQYIVVAEDNPNRSSYDGVLYTTNLAELQYVPEGRTGTVWIAPSAKTINADAFLNRPLISTVIVDSNSGAREELTQDEELNGTNKTFEVLDYKETDLLVAPEPFPFGFASITSLLMGNVALNAGAVSAELDQKASYQSLLGSPTINANGGTLTRQVHDLSANTFAEADVGSEYVMYVTTSGAIEMRSGYRLIRVSYGSDLWDGGKTSPMAIVYISPSRTGYTQTGWLYNDATVDFGSGTSVSMQMSGTYKPVWKANTYTISFNVNNGSGGQSASVTATYDAAMPRISATKPTRTGYIFMGWYDNADYTKGTQYYTAEGASAHTWNIASNKLLYAGWSATPAPKINANGGTLSGQVNIQSPYSFKDLTIPGSEWTMYKTNAGSVFIRSSTGAGLTRLGYWSYQWNEGKPSDWAIVYITCSRTGYTQTGWLYNDAAVNFGTGTSVSMQNSGTYKPVWKANTYTVSFNANGATSTTNAQSANVTATYDAAMPAISTTKPIRDGYTFMGWYDNADYTKGTQYYTDVGASARTWNQATNKTLFAGWKETPLIGSPMINANGGVLTRQVHNIAANSFTNKDVGSEWTMHTTEWGQVFLSPSSTRICYRSNRWDDNKPSPYAYVYVWASRTGYTQTGWLYNDTAVDFGASTSVTMQLSGTYKPAWKANTYAISFNANDGTGGQSANVTATYDAAMPEISTTKPTRAGYTFMGWYDDVDYTKGVQYYTAESVSAQTWNKTANTPLYAGWAPDGDTTYTVKYYFQQPGNGTDGGKFVEDESLKQTLSDGKTDQDLTLASSFAPEIRSKGDYDYVLADESSATPRNWTQKIKGDGSTEFKVYYKLQLTVTYASNDTMWGTAGKPSEVVDWGSNAPTPSATPTETLAYKFKDWTVGAGTKAGAGVIEGDPLPSKIYDTLSCVANFERIEYTLNYADTSDNAVKGHATIPTLQDKFFYDDLSSFAFANDVTTEVGYTFKGWTDGTSIYDAGDRLSKEDFKDKLFRNAPSTTSETVSALVIENVYTLNFYKFADAIKANRFDVEGIPAPITVASTVVMPSQASDATSKIVGLNGSNDPADTKIEGYALTEWRADDSANESAVFSIGESVKMADLIAAVAGEGEDLTAPGETEATMDLYAAWTPVYAATLPTDSATTEILMDITQTSGESTTDVKISSSGPHPLWVMATSQVERDDDGNVALWDAILKDTDERVDDPTASPNDDFAFTWCGSDFKLDGGTTKASLDPASASEIGGKLGFHIPSSGFRVNPAMDGCITIGDELHVKRGKIATIVWTISLIDGDENAYQDGTSHVFQSHPNA